MNIYSYDTIARIPVSQEILLLEIFAAAAIFARIAIYIVAR